MNDDIFADLKKKLYQTPFFTVKPRPDPEKRGALSFSALHHLAEVGHVSSMFGPVSATKVTFSAHIKSQ